MMTRGKTFFGGGWLGLALLTVGCSSKDHATARDAPAIYPPLDFASIGAPVEIANQFLFTEGPVWDPKKQVLYFTDINGDAVYRLTPPSTIDVELKPAGNPDGLALDGEGRLVAAGFVSRDVWRLEGTTRAPVASSYQGKKLNSPDDLCVRRDGVVYFSDPTFGIQGAQGFPAEPQELPFEGLFRVTTDGALHLEEKSVSLAPDGAVEPGPDGAMGSAHPGTNGVNLSPDEKTLYVSYTLLGEVHAFEVAPDGSLSGKRLFASGLPLADSMCVDAGGNLYVAVSSGIAVLDAGGTKLGVIAVPQIPTNCAFGGEDQRTLFITARTTLVGTPAAGSSSLYRVDAMPVPGVPGWP